MQTLCMADYIPFSCTYNRAFPSSQATEMICCPINSSPGLSDLNSRTYPGSMQT